MRRGILEEGGEPTVVRKVVGEPSRHDGRAGDVALPDEHLSQCEFGFGVREDV
jgi:hypothetical protein